MLGYAFSLVPLGLLLGATRDVRDSISPSQMRTTLKRVGWIAMAALLVVGVLGLWALVLAESLRVLVMVATGTAFVLAAVAAHIARLLESPNRAQIGA